jgi:hypothetical protein
LQEAVAENDGKPVASGGFVGPAPGGMIHLPEKAKDLLMGGIMEILQLPERPSYAMLLGALPLYFGKQLYPQAKLGQWRDFLRERDVVLRHQLAATVPVVADFLRQLGDLQFNGVPDKIMYLVNITEGAEGKTFWYQYLSADAWQNMGMAVRVNHLPGSNIISLALTLCRQNGGEGFNLAVVLQKVIHPGTQLVLRDLVHEIKLDVDTTSAEQCRAALQLARFSYANTMADIPELHAVYQRLSGAQQKQFLSMCFDQGIIAKSAYQIFNPADASCAWLRDALLVEVRSDLAKLPALINGKLDSLKNRFLGIAGDGGKNIMNFFRH